MWSIEKSKEHIRHTCGEGWIQLIDEVYANLPDDVAITQTYQKWGALRFDFEPENEIFEELLDSIEERSLSVCEVCSSPAEECIVDGWVETLCGKESCLETCKYINSQIT